MIDFRRWWWLSAATKPVWLDKGDIKHTMYSVHKVWKVQAVGRLGLHHELTQ